MKKLWTWLPVMTFFLAAGLVYVGQQFDVARLTAAGFLCLGFTAMLAGIELIRTRKAFFLPGGRNAAGQRAERYSGLSAQLWGVFFLLLGVGASLAAAAAFFNPERAQTLVDQLLETPAGWGVLLAIFGVFLGLYGTIRLLAGSAAVGRTWQSRLADLGYRGLGGVLLLAGLGLVALGLLLIVAPDLLGAWAAQLFPFSP